MLQVIFKIFILTLANYTLKQGSANHSLQAKSILPPTLVNKVLVECSHAYSFMYLYVCFFSHFTMT